MPLLVRVVHVLVLLRVVVLPGVVVDDAPGNVDAVGGDAKCEGVVGRQNRCPAVPLAFVLGALVAFVRQPCWCLW